MANPITTSLTAYVEEHRIPLIAASALAGKSTSIFNLQTDVKGPTALNILTTDIDGFGDGSDCGWDDNGTATLSQRVIEAVPLKVNMSFCDKKMLAYWTQYEVRVAAGQKTLPFEEDFTNGVVEQVQETLEKLIYAGDSDNTGEFDGLIKILTAASVTTVTSGTTAYDKIKNIYLAMPANVIDKNDAVILVDADLYRSFIQDLVSANLYHYNPENGNDEYYLPGTNVRVIRTNGLNDADATYQYAVAGRLSNFYYGTDALGDESKFDLWYSKDNREFRLAIEFTAGTQVALPSEVVLGKF